MTSLADDIGSFRRRLVGQAKPLTKGFSKASKFVKTGQKWLNSVPTRDCEVIMTFPAKTRESFLMWMLTLVRQRTPELIARIRQHRDTGVYAFYLTASNDSFFRGAEELSLKKRLTDELGGGLKEFMVADADCFKGSDDIDTFFTSEERQRIVRHFLYNLRAKAEDHIGKLSFLEGQAIVPILLSHGIVKQVFALHNEEEVQFLVKRWIFSVYRSQPIDKVCSYFGVKLAMYFAYLGHYTRALVIPSLCGAAVWYLSEQNQDLDDIGVVVFAVVNVVWATLYLEHWKRRSAELAYQWGTLDMPSELLAEPRPLYHGPLKRSKVTGHLEPHYSTWKRHLFRYCVSIPLILLSLGVVFLTMLSIFMLQDWLNDEIKDERFPSCFGFVPKILLALSIGFFDDVYKKLAYWLNDKENHRLDETYETNLVLKLVMFQFVNSFLSLFYIAFYLQDMDRLREQLAALLITRQVFGNIKEAVLPYALAKGKQFHTGYKMSKEAEKKRTASSSSSSSPPPSPKPVFAAAGFDEKPANDNCLLEEEEEEVSERPKEEKEELLEAEPEDVSGKEAGLEDKTDMLIARVTQRSCDKDQDQTRVDGDDEIVDLSATGGLLTQAEVEANWKEYEDTLDDHLEMLIQFGYVTLFSSAFPLAAVCALLNNIIEIRSDAFKLCSSLQRPFGQNVDGIGIWLGALELMSVIAVLVNCALIGFSGLAMRLFPDYSTADRVVFIIILEHAILAGKLLLAFAIPDLPEWVTEEKARLEFQQREALKKVESSTRLSSAHNSAQNSPAHASITAAVVGTAIRHRREQQQQPQSPERSRLYSEPALPSLSHSPLSTPVKKKM